MGRTLPYAPTTLSNAAADSKKAGASEARSGLGYPGNVTLTPSTTPTRYAWDNQQNDRLFRLVGSYICENWAVEPVGGLNVGIGYGVARKADGTDISYAGVASLAIPASKTAYKVYYDCATNAIATAQAWPADKTTFVPVAEIDTDGAAVTEVRSALSLVALAVPASATSINSTNDTWFRIDADNAGAAAANLQLRANRGSGEDAAFEWVEGSGCWRARSQHTTLTRAPIDASEFQIAGTAVITNDGGTGRLAITALKPTWLYTFGANGATPAGLALTAAGAGGAPVSGTHAVGELHLDSNGVLWMCITAGTPGTWRRVARSDALTFVRLDLGADQTGASGTKTVTIQAKDRDGANLAAVQYFQLGVYQDADGAAEASNATLAAALTTGTKIKALSASKVYVVKSDANGTVVLDVTMPNTETVYLLVAPCPRSGYVDCTDIVALTKA